MKNCHYWMIACVGIALAAVFILPRFGVPLAGASILFPLIMIGCCVLPMVFMMMSNREGGKGSCCSTANNKSPEGKIGAEKTDGKSGSCH